MNSTMKKMRKTHEEQAKGIRRKPGFGVVFKTFDVEYAIAKELHKARSKAHLKQGQIAERIGTTQSVVSRIERGGKLRLKFA